MSTYAGRAVFPVPLRDAHGNARGGLSVTAYRRPTYTDGVTTLNDTLLTSDTAAFVATDEGKTGSFEGFPSGAAIDEYVSPTQVRMTVPANSTGTGRRFNIIGRNLAAMLADVWVDRTKTTETGNPFVADSVGNIWPYLDPGDYDATTIHGVTPFTVVADPSEPITEAQLGFSIATQAELDAVDAASAKKAANLSDLADAPTARTNLGLGTIATQDADAVAITGGSVAGIADLAVADGGTGASTAATARTNLGLGTAAVENKVAAGVAGVLDATDPTTSNQRVPTDGSVTTAKIVDGAVTAAKVGADVATQAELDAVNAAKVDKATLDAQSVLGAIVNDTPVALPVGPSEFVGRTATSDVGAVTAIESWAVLGLRVLPVALYAATGPQRAVFGDGLSKPLSSFYATLALAQADYPHVASLDDELDWAIFRAAWDTSYPVLGLADGTFLMSYPIPRANSRTLLGSGSASTTLLKMFNGDLFVAFGDDAELRDLTCDGNGATFTGRLLPIPADANRQSCARVDLLNAEGYCIEFEDKDAGSQFAFMDGHIARFNGAAAGRYSVKIPDTQQLSAKPRKFVAVETNGTHFIDFGGCNNVYAIGCFSAGYRYMAETRAALVVGGRIANITDLTVDGAGNVISGCDVFPNLTLQGAGPHIIQGNALQGTVTDNTTSGQCLVDHKSVTYAVAWTAATTDPSLGDGTLKAEYARTGDKVKMTIDLTIGSTTDLGAGTWRFSVPKTPFPTSGAVQIGQAFLTDSGTTTVAAVCRLLNGGTYIEIQVPGGLSFVNPTTPFTWATGDSLRATIEYMV